MHRRGRGSCKSLVCIAGKIVNGKVFLPPSISPKGKGKRVTSSSLIPEHYSILIDRIEQRASALPKAVPIMGSEWEDPRAHFSPYPPNVLSLFKMLVSDVKKRRFVKMKSLHEENEGESKNGTPGNDDDELRFFFNFIVRELTWVSVCWEIVEKWDDFCEREGEAVPPKLHRRKMWATAGWKNNGKVLSRWDERKKKLTLEKEKLLPVIRSATLLIISLCGTVGDGLWTGSFIDKTLKIARRNLLSKNLFQLWCEGNNSIQTKRFK